VSSCIVLNQHSVANMHTSDTSHPENRKCCFRAGRSMRPLRRAASRCGPPRRTHSLWSSPPAARPAPARRGTPDGPTWR